jgi:hypothetical protein
MVCGPQAVHKGRNTTMQQQSAHPKRPLGRRIQARVMRVVNVPMRVLL